MNKNREYRVILGKGKFWTCRYELQVKTGSKWKSICAFQDKEKCLIELQKRKETVEI